MAEEQPVGFRLRETYLLGTILGAFFAYITTACWIPAYKALIKGTDPVAPPPFFVYIMGAIDITCVLLGFVAGYYLAKRYQRRRPLMVGGGLAAGITSLITFLPPIHENAMAAGMLKIIVIFFVCLCLIPWAFLASEIVPVHLMGEQMHATLLISGIYGTITPIIHGILFSINPALFYWGWLGSSLLLVFMGVCSIFIREPSEPEK